MSSRWDQAAVARIVADRDALGEPERDRVGDRAELTGAQRLRRHAGRLGDRDQLAALGEDDQRDVGVRRRPQRRAVHRLAGELDGVADRDPIALAGAPAVEPDRTVGEQLASWRRPASG